MRGQQGRVGGPLGGEAFCHGGRAYLPEMQLGLRKNKEFLLNRMEWLLKMIISVAVSPQFGISSVDRSYDTAVSSRHEVRLCRDIRRPLPGAVELPLRSPVS